MGLPRRADCSKTAPNHHPGGPFKLNAHSFCSGSFHCVISLMSFPLGFLCSFWNSYYSLTGCASGLIFCMHVCVFNSLILYIFLLQALGDCLQFGLQFPMKYFIPKGSFPCSHSFFFTSSWSSLINVTSCHIFLVIVLWGFMCLFSNFLNYIFFLWSPFFSPYHSSSHHRLSQRLGDSQLSGCSSTQGRRKADQELEAHAELAGDHC